MNALKQFLTENTELSKEQTYKTELRNRGSDLYRMIRDTYEYKTSSDRYTFLVSPVPNERCGIAISTHEEVILQGRFCGADFNERDTKEKSIKAVTKLFKTKVKGVYSESGSIGDSIDVNITIPDDWQTNKKVLHDIALLCSKVFTRFR